MEFALKQIPCVGYPLCSCYFVLKDQKDAESVLIKFHEEFGGSIKLHKSKLKMQIEDLSISPDAKCTVLVTMLVDKEGKVYVEFIRLEGCAFLARKVFIKAKALIPDLIQDYSEAENQHDLELVNTKINQWYRTPFNPV